MTNQGKTEEAKPEDAGAPKLDDTERATLELEYKECSEDWRWRDKYVLEKLTAAGILFGLLGVALGILPPGAWGVKLVLLIIGAFFAFILSISVAKDTYYRDGTERLLRGLSTRLGISHYLQTIKQTTKYLENINDLEFTRKISIEQKKYSLRLPKWFKWLQNPLLNRKTFNWILAFYLTALLVFVILFILIAVDCIWELSLPL